MDISPSFTIHHPWDTLLLVASVVAALATIVRFVILPAWHAWRRVAATWDRIEASVVKTEAQTNGALDARFRSLETGIDGLHQRLDAIERIVADPSLLRPTTSRTRSTDPKD
jgi:hypothetical protein